MSEEEEFFENDFIQMRLKALSEVFWKDFNADVAEAAGLLQLSEEEREIALNRFPTLAGMYAEADVRVFPILIRYCQEKKAVGDSFDQLAIKFDDKKITGLDKKRWTVVESMYDKNDIAFVSETIYEDKPIEEDDLPQIEAILQHTRAIHDVVKGILDRENVTDE